MLVQPRAPSARGVVPWTVYFWTCKYRFAARRHSRGGEDSGERTRGRRRNDIDTRGSNEILVRVTLDGGIIESNVWEVGRRRYGISCLVGQSGLVWDGYRNSEAWNISQEDEFKHWYLFFSKSSLLVLFLIYLVFNVASMQRLFRKCVKFNFWINIEIFFIKNLTYPGIISRYYIFNNNNFPWRIKLMD